MALSIRHSPSNWTERLAIGALLGLVLFLVQLTSWKESDLFWMNAGGYPLWLRECVRSLYYPYLLFVLALGLTITRSVLGRFLHDLSFRRAWGLLVLSWILIFAALGLLLANNLINLIESRPLHYHPPGDSLEKD